MNRKHNLRRNLIFLDKLFAVLVFSLLGVGVIRMDFLMISVYFLLFFYLVLTFRNKAVYHLYVATIISSIWLIFSSKGYFYNRDVLLIFGINSYAFFAWAVGLFGSYIIYSHWEHKLKLKKGYQKFLFYTLIYLMLLIFAETIAYHVFGIANMAYAHYSGLPLCNCIHAPIFVQGVYLLLGPIYFLVCELIGLENPNKLEIRK